MLLRIACYGVHGTALVCVEYGEVTTQFFGCGGIKGVENVAGAPNMESADKPNLSELVSIGPQVPGPTSPSEFHPVSPHQQHCQ